MFPRQAVARWIEKHYWQLLAVGLVAATLVRMPLLNGSFWLDEAAQALESSRPWSQQLQIANDFQPPIYHLIVHCLAQFSHQEWWLRLASLVPGIGILGWLGHWLRRRTNAGVALNTVALLALSSIMIFYAQELRPYMLAVAFSMAAWISFDHLLTDEFPKRRWLWLAVICLSAAWLTSYVTLVIAPIFLLYTLVWRPQHWLVALKTLALSALWWGIWLPGFWQQWQVGQTLQHSLPGWNAVVSPPAIKAGLLTIAKFLVGVTPIEFNLRDGLLIGIPYVFFGISTAWWFWQHRRFTSSSDRWALAVLSMLVSGLIGIWLITIYVPIMAPKRVLFMLPWLMILVAFLASRVRGWGKITLVLFLVWQIWGTVRYWTDLSTQRENWRLAVQTINQRFSPEDSLVIFAFDEPFAPWRWYQTSAFPTLSTGILPLQSVAQFQDKWLTISPPSFVLVFDYLRDLTDPHRIIDSSLQQNGYNELGVWSYPNLGAIHVYQKKQVFAWAGYE